jgi:fumarylacetoacetate (FAA) hydrolase
LRQNLLAMKLVTYIREGHEQLALLVDGQLYNTDSLHPDLPVSMAMFLNYWEDMYPLALNAEARIKEGMSGIPGRFYYKGPAGEVGTPAPPARIEISAADMQLGPFNIKREANNGKP